MKKKMTAMLTVTALCVAVLSGCGGLAESGAATEAAAGTTAGTAQTTAAATITFWHSMGGVNGEAIDYLVNKFNTENSLGIQVESQYQGNYDDAINKLKSAQIGNMGADL